MTDPNHNDFFVEYYNPEKTKIYKYFPYFLIETTKIRYLVLEVKDPSERLDCDYKKSHYSGKKEEISNEVFAKELGFQLIQKIDQNFQYHIIFDAGLQNQQRD